MTRTITSCADCPALNWDRQRCQMADWRGMTPSEWREVDRRATSPAWCPLRAGPITLSLEAK